MALSLLPSSAADADTSTWGRAGSDVGNTRQATSDGPTDPGLKWDTNLDSLRSDDAPDGYSDSATIDPGNGLNAPVIGADGTVMVRASANDVGQPDGGNQLLGLDPDDGSLAWNMPGVVRACGAAVDSQDRTWTGLDAWAHDIDDSVLQAVDSSTGALLTGTQIEPRWSADVGWSSWCDNTSLHIGGDGDLERVVLFDGRESPGIMAIDISGDTPTVAWSIAQDATNPPFDEFVRERDQPRIGAFTDDSILVPVRTDDDFELVELSLLDGSVSNRVTLPTYEEDGQTATDASSLLAANIAVTDGVAVVAAHHVQGGVGALHGVELDGTWNETAWTQVFDAPGDLSFSPTRASGPRGMAVSDGNIISGAGVTVLFGHAASTGTATDWSGSIRTAERAAQGGLEIITDANGTIYTNTPFDDPFQLNHAVTALSPTGGQQWRITRGALLDAIRVDDTDLVAPLRLGPIDADGTLYLHGGSDIVAVDDSGGLADTRSRFTDVSPDGVHAGNIERLVAREITSGLTETTYGPDQPVTRAQFATFLVRALGEDRFPSESFIPGDAFDDVNADSVHAPNIYAVAEAGFTTGVTATTFEPNRPLPRDQMASLLVRAFGDEVFPSDIAIPGDAFNDVNADSVHADNINIVAEVGVTTGRTPTTFDPKGTVLRGQMASFLMRTLDEMADEDA